MRKEIASIEKILKASNTDESDVSRLHDGEILFLWCCDCDLRHVVHVRIVRGKAPTDDFVELEHHRDQLATDFRRFYRQWKASEGKAKSKKGKK